MDQNPFSGRGNEGGGENRKNILWRMAGYMDDGFSVFFTAGNFFARSLCSSSISYAGIMAWIHRGFIPLSSGSEGGLFPHKIRDLILIIHNGRDSVCTQYEIFHFLVQWNCSLYYSLCDCIIGHKFLLLLYGQEKRIWNRQLCGIVRMPLIAGRRQLPGGFACSRRDGIVGTMHVER